MVTRQHDARAHARTHAMDAQLSALAKAQDEFRNAVSVGLGEMRTAYEGVARESASEAKGRASERDAARRAIETSEQAREKLEQKLLQCEEALREAKGALVETREQAKDVRDSDSIRFRCARDRGDDFDDSRVERPRFSTARGRDDDDVMCARVSPRRDLSKTRTRTRVKIGSNCARESRRSARIRMHSIANSSFDRRATRLDSNERLTRVSRRDAGDSNAFERIERCDHQVVSNPGRKEEERGDAQATRARVEAAAHHHEDEG